MSHGQNSLCKGIIGIIWDPYYLAARAYIRSVDHGSYLDRTSTVTERTVAIVFWGTTRSILLANASLIVLMGSSCHYSNNCLQVEGGLHKASCNL